MIFHLKLRNFVLMTALTLLSTNFTAKEASAQSCQQVEQHVAREILSQMPPITSSNYVPFWQHAIQWANQMQQRYPNCSITRGNGGSMDLFQQAQQTVDRVSNSVLEADRSVHRTTMGITCSRYGGTYREDLGRCVGIDGAGL
jgi:hypothetical protein